MWQQQQQWSLNPQDYVNVPNTEVDWAALAKQWMAKKEDHPLPPPPPPPSAGSAPPPGEDHHTVTSGKIKNETVHDFPRHFCHPFPATYDPFTLLGAHNQRDQLHPPHHQQQQQPHPPQHWGWPGGTGPRPHGGPWTPKPPHPSHSGPHHTGGMGAGQKVCIQLLVTICH